MKIDKLLKIVMIILLVVMVIAVAVPVNADSIADLLNDDEYDTDIPVEGDSTDDTDSTGDTSGTDSIEDTSDKSDNVSTYDNNTNLPKAGIQDWNMGIVLIVVCAISGIYAVKKINDYKNI